MRKNETKGIEYVQRERKGKNQKCRSKVNVDEEEMAEL